MTKVICLIGVFMSLSVGAAVSPKAPAYDLQMDLSVKGKHVSSPHIVVMEGETASVIQDNNGEKTFVDVVATQSLMDGEKVVFMNFKIGTISDSGEKRVISTPQITSFENEKAQITVGDEDGKEDLSLSVLAKRKAL